MIDRRNENRPDLGWFSFQSQLFCAKSIFNSVTLTAGERRRCLGTSDATPPHSGMGWPALVIGHRTAFSKSDAGCLHSGQMKSSGGFSPS